MVRDCGGARKIPFDFAQDETVNSRFLRTFSLTLRTARNDKVVRVGGKSALGSVVFLPLAAAGGALPGILFYGEGHAQICAGVGEGLIDVFVGDVE